MQVHALFDLQVERDREYEIGRLSPKQTEPYTHFHQYCKTRLLLLTYLPIHIFLFFFLGWLWANYLLDLQMASPQTIHFTVRRPNVYAMYIILKGSPAISIHYAGTECSVSVAPASNVAVVAFKIRETVIARLSNGQN